MSLSVPSVTNQHPIGIEFASIVEGAYNKAGLSEDEAQRVNDTPGLAQSVGNFIAENRHSNQFSNEEVKSSYGYLSGYKPKGITEQTNILRQLFPSFGFADEQIASEPLPPDTEGRFAIPRWETMAATYGEAVQKVFDMIKKTRGGKFHNYRDGQFGPQYLRQSAESVEAFRKLGDEQKDHDILVVAAQFGIRHRGRSVRRAREVMNDAEFGLGAFAVGIMLLTHPERLKHFNDLWIDCAGDEFSFNGGGGLGGAPCFFFFHGTVKFSTNDIVDVHAYFGSASASVSK
jgi:hypothetical protein